MGMMETRIVRDGRFWCCLAEYAGLAKALYIGCGCSSSMFNTQREAFLAGKGKEYLKSIGKEAMFEGCVK
jgi:hypothetical protein